MRPEGLEPVDFKTASKIFSTNSDVWVKLTEWVRRGLRWDPGPVHKKSKKNYNFFYTL